jgi:hypothetical protein
MIIATAYIQMNSTTNQYKLMHQGPSKPLFAGVDPKELAYDE